MSDNRWVLNGTCHADGQVGPSVASPADAVTLATRGAGRPRVVPSTTDVPRDGEFHMCGLSRSGGARPGRARRALRKGTVSSVNQHRTELAGRRADRRMQNVCNKLTRPVKRSHGADYGAWRSADQRHDPVPTDTSQNGAELTGGQEVKSSNLSSPTQRASHRGAEPGSCGCHPPSESLVRAKRFSRASCDAHQARRRVPRNGRAHDLGDARTYPVLRLGRHSRPVRRRWVGDTDDEDPVPPDTTVPIFRRLRPGWGPKSRWKPGGTW